jgi:beta-galactosidase
VLIDFRDLSTRSASRGCNVIFVSGCFAVHKQETTMHRLFLRIIAAFAFAGLVSALPAWAKNSDSPRQLLKADANWRFFLGDPVGAESPSFSDASWRTVDLPHDWSIESAPDAKNPSGAGGGFFPAGTGWYRKTFRTPAEWRGKRVSVEFDGVYRDATVYLNGHKLGMHPYGYTAFAFDLTSNLDFSAANVLAVRVDNSAQPNSRWYSGSGIYRHVQVNVTNPTHIAHWGVFVTTSEASKESAKVSIRTKVANETEGQGQLVIETVLFDKAGKKVGSSQSTVAVDAGKEADAGQEITVKNPALWSPESPTLYRAVSQVRQNGKLVDETTTSFGIRTLAWSAEKGLLLNGTPVKLTGGSVHHDNGPLGAAAFDRAEERRVELLKAAGHNAVRTAHNPPSSAFLDACDRLGLLVLDEPFDVWKAHKVKFDYGSDFDEWWKPDISSMVMRDRNHPSIVIWGIGNEIPELEVDSGKVIAKQLADQVRALDSSRPLTLAFPGTTTAPNAAAVFSLLDIAGYNYNLIPSYAADHAKLPSRIMLTTESHPQKAFPLWQITNNNSFVMGDLTWTAMDYLGESGIGAWSYATPEQFKIAQQMMGMMENLGMIDQMFLGMAKGVDVMAEMSKGNSDPAAKAAMEVMFHGYPWHAAACGDMDLTGYRKPQSYYRDIIWNGGNRVYATVRLPEPDGKKIIAVGWATYPTLPSWSWPGREGKDMEVEVYAGTEKVRLYLNDKLIGEVPTTIEQQRRAVFKVPYAEGTLKAVGLNGDREVASSVLETAGEASKLQLKADRDVLQADGQDLSFITIETVDTRGRFQPTAENKEVKFTVSGPGKIIAVGNGDGASAESYQGNRRALFNGRALVVIRTSGASGAIHLTAEADGLGKTELTVQSHAVKAVANLD